MYIQHQHWKGTCDRILIADFRGHGTVQVDIPNTPEGRKKLKADAFLWALWIDEGKDLYNEPYRRRGEATILMKAAEDEAKKKGCKSIALEWSLKESPYWVHDWYERLGYEDKEFGNGCALMVKEL